MNELQAMYPMNNVSGMKGEDNIMASKVTIDRDGCIGCGMCWATCPSVYEQNTEDSKSQIILALQDAGNPAVGKIPDKDVECAHQGADVCPVSVISVE